MKDYWAENTDENYQFRETRELQFLVDFLRCNAESIFEASIGTGIIPFMLRKANWDGKYVGSDYTKHFVNAASIHNPKEQIIMADLLRPINIQDKSFDICVIHHGLEYVYPYKPAIEELKRLAKKYVVISMWQPLFSRNVIRFNKEGKWNVNFYEEQEFRKTIGDTVLEAEVKNDDGKLNYWYILKAYEDNI
jgi:ubiquinone/menaquinone biosynthesis C-methylase UbiE